MFRSRFAGLRAAMMAALALAGASCATGGAPPPKQAGPTPGQAIVERACAGCHATGASGASRNPDAPTFRELARRRSDAELAAALDRIAEHGHVEMPPIYVTPAERAQIVGYMRELRARARNAGPDPAALRGRDFVITNCSGCHAVGLKGVSPYRSAPPFRTLRGTWSADALRLRLERSPVHDGPDMTPRALTAAQADDLAAYIRALQEGQDLGRPVFTGPLCNPMYWC